jgi:hypothetical protein
VRELIEHPDCSKAYSEYFDPCQEAADRSLRCLRRNGGDKALCQDYFEYARLHSKLSSDAWTNNETEHTVSARSNGYDWNCQDLGFYKC